MASTGLFDQGVSLVCGQDLGWMNLHTYIIVGSRCLQTAQPAPAQCVEFDLSARYVFWKYGLAYLSGIISLTNCTYSSTDNPFQHGYLLNKGFLLTGIGLGANFSCVHGEVVIHGWPRTVIGTAVEPNGVPPGPIGQAWYSEKPIYPDSMISLTVGLEFGVLGF